MIERKNWTYAEDVDVYHYGDAWDGCGVGQNDNDNKTWFANVIIEGHLTVLSSESSCEAAMISAEKYFDENVKKEKVSEQCS